MSLCLNCGAENDPGLDTCIVCGSKLEPDLDESFVPFNQPEEPTVEPVDAVVPDYEPEMPVLEPEMPVAPVDPIVPDYEPEMPTVAPVDPVVPSYENESPIIENPVFEQPMDAGVPFDQFVPTESVTPVAPFVPDADASLAADQGMPAYDNFAPVQPQGDFVPQQEFSPAPAAASVSSDDDSTKTLSVGGFLFTFIMCIIPVVNLIALISWACGASKNKNRVNFARAAIIIAIIFIAALVALFMTDILKIDYLVDWINGILGMQLL